MLSEVHRRFSRGTLPKVCKYLYFIALYWFSDLFIFNQISQRYKDFTFCFYFTYQNRTKKESLQSSVGLRLIRNVSNSRQAILQKK